MRAASLLRVEGRGLQISNRSVPCHTVQCLAKPLIGKGQVVKAEQDCVHAKGQRLLISSVCYNHLSSTCIALKCRDAFSPAMFVSLSTMFCKLCSLSSCLIRMDFLSLCQG